MLGIAAETLLIPLVEDRVTTETKYELPIRCSYLSGLALACCRLAWDL